MKNGCRQHLNVRNSNRRLNYELQNFNCSTNGEQSKKDVVGGKRTTLWVEDNTRSVLSEKLGDDIDVRGGNVKNINYIWG
jgi:hypothetical protein